jgi:hypothetical protein
MIGTSNTEEPKHTRKGSESSAIEQGECTIHVQGYNQTLLKKRVSPVR